MGVAPIRNISANDFESFKSANSIMMPLFGRGFGTCTRKRQYCSTDFLTTIVFTTFAVCSLDFTFIFSIICSDALHQVSTLSYFQAQLGITRSKVSPTLKRSTHSFLNGTHLFRQVRRVCLFRQSTKKSIFFGRSEKIRTFNTHGLNVRPLPIGIRFYLVVFCEVVNERKNQQK